MLNKIGLRSKLYVTRDFTSDNGDLGGIVLTISSTKLVEELSGNGRILAVNEGRRESRLRVDHWQSVALIRDHLAEVK